MMTGLVVLKMVLMPSRHRFPSLANSGPRWSIMGVSMARKMRSGRGVGPGICKKWRPTGREEFLDIGHPWAGGLRLAERSTAESATCRHQLRMRQSVKSNLNRSVSMGHIGWRIAGALRSLPPNSVELTGVKLHE